MARNTVLYVEDEEDDVLFMRMAFKRAGAAQNLQAVADGQKAIEYLAGAGQYANREQYPLPSAILLDLNLPRRSGFEVLQWLRQQNHLREVPVVVFSSSGRIEDREKARELGADDYIQKPGSGLEFSDVVCALQRRWFQDSMQ